MNFNNIDNNKELISKLQSTIAAQKVHHGYIFEAPLSVDKLGFAKSFIKGILCKEKPGLGCDSCFMCKKIENGNHLDITFIEAETAKGRRVKSIKDEQIEKLQERLSKKPFEGDRNIAIIKDADTMSFKAFNRFLKTLEEPPIGTVIIMLSENTQVLPRTILSRCVQFRVSSWEEKDETDMKNTARNLVDMLKEKQSYYRIKKVIDSIDKEKIQAELLLDLMEEVYREETVKNLDYVDKNIYDSIEIIERTRRDIKNNINIGYSLKLMALTIGG